MVDDGYSLVYKNLAMLFAPFDGLTYPGNRMRVGPWTLQEPTIAPDGIADSILCGTVEFCIH